MRLTEAVVVESGEEEQVGQLLGREVDVLHLLHVHIELGARDAQIHHGHKGGEELVELWHEREGARPRPRVLHVERRPEAEEVQHLWFGDSAASGVRPSVRHDR